MAKSIKRLTLLTIIFLLGLATAANAFGDEYTHIDTMAVKIQRQTKALLKETIHYRHTANYRHMVSDCAELNQLAAHIHDLVHHEANIFHVESDLTELDSTFHHIENLFDNTEVSASYGRGHIHGNTAHVKRLLESIEDCIHHMQDDIAAIRRRTASCAVIAPVITTYRTPYVNRQTTVRNYGNARVVTERVISRGGSVYGGGHYGHGHGNVNRGYGNRGGINIELDRRGHNNHGHGHSRGRGHDNRRSGFTIGGGSSKIRINF